MIRRFSNKATIPLRKSKVDATQNKESQIIVGSLIALDVLAVIQMLGLPTLDFWLKTSLYFFAVSVPLLSLCALTAARDSSSTWRAEIWYIKCSNVLGRCAALAAGALVFAHFSRKAGALFIVLIALGVVAHTHYIGTLERINKQSGQ